MAGGSRDGGRTVASKVVQILAAFDERQPLTASEVCRRSGMPFSTVHRLLVGLAADGLLHRSPDGGYSVGIRVWELAAGHPRLRDLHAAALPVMSRLHAALGASVYLHVLVGAEALCVEELRCPDGPTRRYGTRSPLRAAAGGQVLLAYAQLRSLREILGGPLRDPALSSRRLGELLHIQQAGAAVSVDDDFLAAAAPVFDHVGAAAASIEAVAACPADQDRLVRAVRAAASDLAAYPLNGNGNPISVQWR
jgi:DNA-binding IclR family transcriptional regulator